MNLRLYLYAGLALALIASGALPTRWYYKGEIADIRQEYAQVEIKNQARARETEGSRQAKVDAATEKGATDIEAIRIDDRDDGAAADRLRDELTALRKRYAIENSKLATASATDRQAVMVFTELYQGSVERERILAAAFEEARARGLTCEGAYSALIQAEQQ